MMSRSNKQQNLFSDAEQFLCACGCNQYGFRTKRGQKRQYLNATHKKRAQRARIKDKENKDRMQYTPSGWLYLMQSDSNSIDELWAAFSDQEKAVIMLICEAFSTPTEFFETVTNMFSTPHSKRRLTHGDSWWNYVD